MRHKWIFQLYTDNAWHPNLEMIIMDKIDSLTFEEAFTEMMRYRHQFSNPLRMYNCETGEECLADMFPHEA